MTQYSTIFLSIAVILIGLPVLALCIFWLSGFAVFAAVLQRLLQDAIDIKSKNDLTV